MRNFCCYYCNAHMRCVTLNPGTKLKDFVATMQSDEHIQSEIGKLRKEVEEYAKQFPTIGFEKETMKYNCWRRLFLVQGLSHLAGSLSQMSPASHLFVGWKHRKLLSWNMFWTYGCILYMHSCALYLVVLDVDLESIQITIDIWMFCWL